MPESPDRKLPREGSHDQAAAWVLKCDRGLSAEEQDEFFRWLAENPGHGMALAHYRKHWRRMDRLVQWRPEYGSEPNPDLLAPPAMKRSVGRISPFWLLLPAAAAIMLGAVIFRPGGSRIEVEPPAVATTSVPGARRQILPDGSVVEWNRGAVFAIDYHSGARRVRLERGEAYFTVKRDPEQPFIVSAGGIDVRAVGTAFNVRMDAEAVEVLVTAGSVRVDSPIDPGAGSGPAGARGSADPFMRLIEANHKVVVPNSTVDGLPKVTALTTGEIERELSWQHRKLEFSGALLSDIVAEFNRRNDVQLILADEELASVSISGSVRSDNIDGFLRLLEAGFGILIEPNGGERILLRRKAE
ncbi:MAG: FecR domain-containing protein [Opitutus sp.]